MYKVEKTILDDIEILPDIVDTLIWKDYDELNCSKNIRLIATLYKAVSQRENYFQLNTPNAFGNPQYNYYCGLVSGILQGAEMEEISESNQIIFKRNNRKLLIVDKIKRPQIYYDTARENGEILNGLGLEWIK